MKKKLEQVHNLEKRAHSVYTINYHIIQCVKYRKKVFCFEKIERDLENRVKYISKKWKVDVLAFGVDKDHFHLLVSTISNLDISKYIGNLKSSTSRYLRNRYDFLNRAIPKCLWSPSYCIITCGNVPLPIVNSYVKNQGKKPSNI